MYYSMYDCLDQYNYADDLVYLDEVIYGQNRTAAFAANPCKMLAKHENKNEGTVEV